MKKVLLLPDSLKGSMDSSTICGIMEDAILRHYPDARVESLPVADGGEGSVDSFLKALGGEKVKIRVKGPLFEEVDAFYGLINQGNRAVIEMAACAGLPLMGSRKDPLITTTYGVGQLIQAAAARGVREIILGLGGSATNDGGCGAAAALGIRFLDQDGLEFIPVGGTLERISRIDAAQKSGLLENLKVRAMCDIDNPLYGPRGAAYVFAPQKGADEKGVKKLDAGLLHLALMIERDLGLQVADLPGSGAAGGVGAGAYAFLGASLEAGIEVVLDAICFDRIARDADLILTGEGKIDQQSLAGKVVIGVARRAKRLGIPVAAIVGDIGEGIEGVYEEGVSGIFSINRLAVDFALARKRSPEDLALTVDNLMRFLKQLAF
ncbi:MAG: glycerate kinase [Clostridiaceae bacterium]|nr:glycerate kinase [Clostridiaceae bacterium]